MPKRPFVLYNFLVRLSGKQVQCAGNAGRQKANTWRSHQAHFLVMNPDRCRLGGCRERGERAGLRQSREEDQHMGSPRCGWGDRHAILPEVKVLLRVPAPDP